MSKRCVLVVAVLLVFSQTARMQKSRTLDIYSIDVEGGQATLFVSPSGESLLVDAGNPGDRDADRIAASAKEAGVSRIDYLVITHYDGDHVGGVKDVASRLPIRTFVDHGPRKAIRKRGKGLHQMHAGNFPVSGRAVLARRRRSHASPRPGSIPTPAQSFERFDVAQAKQLQAGKLQPTARARQITQRVAALVPVIACVGGLADPNTVENYDRGALQLRSPA